MNQPVYDIAIIGAGIVGLASAWQIIQKFPSTSLVILETENHVGQHQTSHNSGVIHAGLYYKPGSLKAKNCVEGRKLLIEFCKNYQIPFEICGKLVVAVTEDEIPRLNELEKRAHANGLQNVKRLDANGLKNFEPHVSAVAGLHVPETGIVDYKQVALKLEELLIQKNVVIKKNEAFTNLRHDTHHLILETTKSEIKSKHLINCAGLYSDRVAKACGFETDVQIIPFRGDYYELKESKKNLVNNLIYPVPDPAFPFLGVHLTRMITGQIEAGPNAVLSLQRNGYSRFSFDLWDSLETFLYKGFGKLSLKYWKMGLDEIKKSYHQKTFAKALAKLVPEIKTDDIQKAGSGIRAQAIDKNGNLLDDFSLIKTNKMIHILNAPSPAATSSLAIGNKVCELVLENFDL